MSAVAAFVYAFGLSVCAILVLQPLCLRFSHVDKPGGRKTHQQETPLSGGIAIAACVIALGSLVMPLERFAGFASGALVLLCLGALDDRRPVSPLYVWVCRYSL